jgi:hypothetical protein
MRNLPSPGDRFVQMRGDIFKRVRKPVAAYDALPDRAAPLGGHMSDKTHPATAALMKILDFLANEAGLDQESMGVVKNLADGWMNRPTQDSGRNYEWAADWAREKGMSEDDIAEFVEGLQQHGSGAEPPDFPGKPKVGGGQLPLNAQDRKRMANDAARAAASSSNQAAFEKRFPAAKRLQQGSNSSDSVAALRSHMSKIGVV